MDEASYRASLLRSVVDEIELRPDWSAADTGTYRLDARWE